MTVHLREGVLSSVFPDWNPNPFNDFNRTGKRFIGHLPLPASPSPNPLFSSLNFPMYFGENESDYSRKDSSFSLSATNYVIDGGDGDTFTEAEDEGFIFGGGYNTLTTSDLAVSLSSSGTTENYVFGGSENGVETFWQLLDAKNLRHSVGWTVALIVAYVLILLIGIVGNCMVILVVLLRPQMRTVTNMFIMNLAVADLFVIVFCVPATLLANVLIPWILGSFMCKGVAYVQGVSVCASAYSLAAISLDRCKAIYRPMERPRGLSKSQAMVTICLIWILALLMTLPWAVVFDVIKSEKSGLAYCLETWRNEEHGKVYFLVANLICCYSLPLVLISLSNVVIWCHVSRRKVPQDTASIGNIKRMHRRTRHGVRKMLGIVTLAFLISWLPLYVLVARMKFSPQESIGETEANLLSILIPFAQWLGSWNSSINPVLYAFLNSKFRESFRSLLPTWMPLGRRKPGVGMVGMVTNGTIIGTTGTPSYTTVYTARSSARSQRSAGGGLGSSGGSRRSHHYHTHRTFQQVQQSQHRSLIVSHVPKNPHAPTTTPTSATITDL